MASTRDDARSVLADPRAPADERFDAQSELERPYVPSSAGGLIPRADLQPVIDLIHEGLEGEAAVMAKSARQESDPGLFPGRRRGAGADGPRSVLLDEFGAQVTGTYYEKPGALTFDMLRRMVKGMPILSAIVLLRMRQVQRFCQPSEDGGIGFEIRHRDKEHRPTAEEKARMNELSRFFSNCGWEFNPRARKRLKRENFASFVGKMIRDTLTMDAAPIELEPKNDASLGTDGFYALDGATVRLCTEDGWEDDPDIYAIQLVEGRLSATYTHDELIYEVRNQGTDVDSYGYGYPEPELLVKVVTAFLNGFAYNSDVFDKNSIPKGLLQLTGEYSKEDMAAFKRMWNAQVRGVENRHALPVLASREGDAKAVYTPFQNEQDEMAYAKWMTFLTSVSCAIYGCDPEEISFETFSANRSALSGRDTEHKLSSSRDKGLRPLMAWAEGLLSDFIVTAEHPDLVFRWNGLDEEDADKAWEAKKLTLTVDEMRAEHGYEPHPCAEIGEAPLNPALIEPWLQMKHPNLAMGPDFGGQAPRPVEQEEGGDEFGGEAPPPLAEPVEGDAFGGIAPPPDQTPTDFGSPEPAPTGPQGAKKAPKASKPTGSDRPRKSQ